MQAVGLLDILQELCPTTVFHDDVALVHCFHHWNRLVMLGWYRVC
jgi:hypothetical protein